MTGCNCNGTGTRRSIHKAKVPSHTHRGALPLPLVNTYGLYKTGTDNVAAFLLNAADQIQYFVKLDSGNNTPSTRPMRSSMASSITICSSSSDIPSGNYALRRLRGSSKKRRGPSFPKPNLKSNQYIDIAKHIVTVNGKPPVKGSDSATHAQQDYTVVISDSFITTLEATIKAREKVSDFYRANGSRFDDLNLQQHLHFIEVLREVLSMLQPYSNCLHSSLQIPDINLERNECNFETKHGATRWDDNIADSSVIPKALENRFIMLCLEDPAEEEQKDTTEVNSPKNPSGDTTFTSDHFNEILQIHCFLLDIQALRDFIIETWKRYKNKEDDIDLITAALSTNTAIELAVNLYKNLTDQFPPLQNYDELLSKYYTFCSSSQEGSETSGPEKEKQLKYRERPEDQINFKLAGMHDLTMYATVFFLKEAMHSAVPLSRKKLRNAYDQRISRSDMNVREKYHQNRHILHDLLADLRIFAPEAGKLGHNIDDRVSDQVTTHIATIFDNNTKKKCPSFGAVFAAQTLLDMTYASGNNPCEAFHHLEDDACYIRSSVRYACGCDNPECNDGTIRMLHDHFLDDCLKDNGLFLNTWIFADEVERVQKLRYGEKEYNKHYKRKKSQWLLKNNPLLCGVIQFSARMRFRDVSLMVSNGFFCVNTICHVYNAWHANTASTDTHADGIQSIGSGSAGKPIWPDMEYFISAFDSKTVFAGARPMSVASCVDRFHDAVAQRKSQWNCQEGLEFWEQFFSPTIQFFSQRFGKHLSGSYWHIGTVDTLVRDQSSSHNTKSANTTGASSLALSPTRLTTRGGSRHKKQKKRAAPMNSETFSRDFHEATVNHTATEVLTKLRDSLVVESRHLRFDFLLFHRHCLDLILIICGMIYKDKSDTPGWSAKHLQWPMEGIFATMIQNLNSELIQVSMASSLESSEGGKTLSLQNFRSGASIHRYKRCKLTAMAIMVINDFIKTGGSVQLEMVEQVARGEGVEIPVYSAVIATDANFCLRSRLFNIDHEHGDYERIPDDASATEEELSGTANSTESKIDNSTESRIDISAKDL